MKIKCTLDQDECIDLLTALRIVNQIDQEQAWAICYQIGALMQRLKPANCAIIDSLDQIYLHKDGSIHEKSCLISRQKQQHHKPVQTSAIDAPQANTRTTTTTTATEITSSQGITNTQSQMPPTPPITPELNELLRRRPALNETELVASLGIALFWALDYGIADDEERQLSIAMEYFIVQTHQSKLSLNEVLEICIKRLPIATKSQADLHYRSVCKSLVNDTIELSMFLEKIYTASMVLRDITLDDCLSSTADPSAKHNKCDIDKDLEDLGEPLASLRALRINDWARLWMQVIRELRQRGKFQQAGYNGSV